VTKKRTQWIMLAMAGALLGASAVGAQTAPVKIGVVNQDRVLNDSDEGKRLKADLEKLRNAKAASIEAKEKEIKALQDQLLNAQLSLSEEKRDEIARDLKRKRVAYERLNDDATAEFQDAANRAQARLSAIFRDAVAKYGAENGFTVIFEMNTLYYATPTVDVTDDMLKRFNQATQGPAAGPKQP